ncbi:phage tail protein [Carnobacterium divergens]|uniref:phage tail protein n=1 Tax=Carnobacterium divergens TaxID=2748 RepID=UPI0039AF8C29
MIKNLNDYGISFNGHHSKEFGLDVLSKKIGFPSKNKALREIPHSNEVYDFSEVYGTQNYTERPIEIVFHIIDRSNWDKESMYIMWTKVVAWLMEPSHKIPLYDDIMKEYYYLGEVQEKPDFDEMRFNGKFKVIFQCYPFRIHELQEGNDIWDTFNFELDIAQIVKHDIKGSKQITLYNIGMSNLPPVVVATSEMEIQFKGKSYKVLSGENKVTGFYLLPGINEFKVIGNGTIEFEFHKEVI